MVDRVMILGCGPTGLLAAHAAELAGREFVILSKRRKSRLFGCQYLHQPIPEITEGPGVEVDYSLSGSIVDYRRKVYGDEWNGDASPGVLEQSHKAWDIRSAYDKLWRLYSPYVVDCQIEGYDHVKFMANAYNAGIVISTVPRKIWANPGDTFASVKIWAFGDAPEFGQHVPFRPRDFKVLCDGTDEIGWYRLSRVFGHCTVEYPGKIRPPIGGIQMVEKPLWHNSNAANDFVHIGRYGAWKKGVLTTDAFHEALEVVR